MKSSSSQLLTSLPVMICLTFSCTAGAEQKAQAELAQGKVIAERMCQACHAFTGAEQPGTVAPPLVAMKQRFPDRNRLHAIIYDAQKAIKPHTMMPPFGRNALLDETQIERLIDFLYSL